MWEDGGAIPASYPINVSLSGFRLLDDKPLLQTNYYLEFAKMTP